MKKYLLCLTLVFCFAGSSVAATGYCNDPKAAPSAGCNVPLENCDHIIINGQKYKVNSTREIAPAGSYNCSEINGHWYGSEYRYLGTGGALIGSTLTAIASCPPPPPDNPEWYLGECVIYQQDKCGTTQTVVNNTVCCDNPETIGTPPPGACPLPEPAHCTDGVKSGDEEYIDCGGSCSAVCDTVRGYFLKNDGDGNSKYYEADFYNDGSYKEGSANDISNLWQPDPSTGNWSGWAMVDGVWFQTSATKQPDGTYKYESVKGNPPWSGGIEPQLTLDLGGEILEPGTFSVVPSATEWQTKEIVQADDKTFEYTNTTTYNPDGTRNSTLLTNVLNPDLTPQYTQSKIQTTTNVPDLNVSFNDSNIVNAVNQNTTQTMNSNIKLDEIKTAINGISTGPPAADKTAAIQIIDTAVEDATDQATQLPIDIVTQRSDEYGDGTNFPVAESITNWFKNNFLPGAGTSCQDLDANFPDINLVIPCEFWNKLKSIMSWVLSVWTIIYIFEIWLATPKKQ